MVCHVAWPCPKRTRAVILRFASKDSTTSPPSILASKDNFLLLLSNRGLGQCCACCALGGSSYVCNPRMKAACSLSSSHRRWR